MAEVKPKVELLANIKVVGVGGSGGNAVNRMVEAGLKGVEFIAINTDSQALHSSKASKKIHIGKTVTRGLGAGMNPDVGRQAVEENQNDIRDALKDTDMVFITCGLGGGTGTGATPIVAEISRDLGILTVAVVTKPFSFEGAQRKNIAERGLAELKDKVDAIITIPNDRIFQVVDKKTSLLDAFSIVDDILRQGIQGVSEVITIPALINIDMNDMRSIMKNAGSALMGVGQAGGENRAIEAAKAAVNSPLLEMSIDGARGILYVITGGPEFTMNEALEVSKVITSSADEDAKIIFGVAIDPKMKDEVKVSVIATGFDPITNDDDIGSYADQRFVSNVSQRDANRNMSQAVDEYANREYGADRKIENQQYYAQENKLQSKSLTSKHKEDEEDDSIPPFLKKKFQQFK